MATLCSSRRPVLLHGETGVGKELLARTLHDSSPDPRKPYVVVNCAAVPENLLEAEMFGIVKGAATGVEPREGYFAHAHGGTLFLDEIGELTPTLQAKLLRTLQENEIQPVGGRPRPIDVWVIAATHADLRSDKLRRDLYYRMAGGLLEVPPLRRCQDDVPALVRRFLAAAAAEAGIPLRGVTVRALGRLRSYGWPGNVRELEHAMRRVVRSRPPGGIVDEDGLPEEIRSEARHLADVRPSAETDDLELRPRVETLERFLIREAMRRAGGRQVKAAELLGVSRSGLAKMLERLDLKHAWARPDVKEVDSR
jgi:two-component system response regulator HupR/HoxA